MRGGVRGRRVERESKLLEGGGVHSLCSGGHFSDVLITNVGVNNVSVSLLGGHTI
jgi:hypothetical protein